MIIRPFLYDIKRTITSKTVLILVGVLLIISLAVFALASVNLGGGFGSGTIPVLYYNDGEYHFLAYFSNQYGDPISGARLDVNLTIISPPASYSHGAVTNDTGIASVTVKAPPNNYTALAKETIGNLVGEAPLYLPPKLKSGTVWTLEQTISSVIDKSNSSKRDVQIFYAGANGTPPTGYRVYYKVGSSSFYYNQSAYNVTRMNPLATMSTYHQIFDPPIPPGANQTAAVLIALFPPTNNTAVATGFFQVSTFRPMQQSVNGSALAAVFFSQVLGLFIPLMAIIGSYSSYGKDRLTGVLESVLARPVTRRSLGLSRFLSTVIAFSLAVIACVGLVDLIVDRITGSFIPQGYALSVMGSMVVEVAAFTGIIFLLSHLVKSTGALLGISIGMFVILDFLWSFIIFLLTLLLGGTLGSAVGIEATLISYYANPAQFVQLVNTYTFQSVFGIPIPSSSYGVTLPAIVLDGILWSVVPFVLFLYLAARRD